MPTLTCDDATIEGCICERWKVLLLIFYKTVINQLKPTAYLSLLRKQFYLNLLGILRTNIQGSSYLTFR